MVQDMHVLPFSLLSFQVCETPSNSVIACEREELLSTYLIGERWGRKGGVKCFDGDFVFFLSFFGRENYFSFWNGIRHVCVRSKYTQLLGIQLLINYGIVAKRPRCELGLHFAACFITKTRRNGTKGATVWCSCDFWIDFKMVML